MTRSSVAVLLKSEGTTPTSKPLATPQLNERGNTVLPKRIIDEHKCALLQAHKNNKII